MTEPLTITGLDKRFGGLHVTRGVSLHLPAGARHALIGPNGAGKSTLINLITGMIRPDRGTIVMNGRDITTQPPAQRVQGGLARTFQVTTAFPDLAVFDAVLLSIMARTRQTRRLFARLTAYDAEGAEALDLLTRLGLHDVAAQPIRTIAYGQLRLLEIALALAAKPRVLLLDEPAAGVPHSESEAVFAAIRDLPGDVAVLFIEHDMELVFRFAAHIHVLVAGAILCAGTPAQIAADPAVRDVYLGSEEAA